ncbi:hypothetical protein [Ahniella affigens]|uniref:hypothetical protein n=1 Tax=Ahniella affigens TaxID=2021234 RepID=UPI0011B1EDC6|nr:hypothetical protein [Ahniella affigens]
MNSAHVAHGPSSLFPPFFDVRESPERESIKEQSGPSLPQLDLPIRHSGNAPSSSHDLGGVRAPGTFNLIRRTLLSPISMNSTIAEPSLAGQGRAILETYNTYAAITSDNGQTRSYIDPDNTFPLTPVEFSNGVCCDQRVAQDPTRDLVFWYMQYRQTFGGINGVRLAMAQGSAGLETNTWSYWNFVPSQFGLTDVWIDFPHLQVGANFLYFTSNLFRISDDTFYGSVIVRISLDELAASGPINFRYLVSGRGSVMIIPGYGSIGSRPGTNFMNFANVLTSNSIEVTAWPEGSNDLNHRTITGLSTTQLTGFTCLAPNGSNPCARSNARMQSGWLTDTEIGLAWHSAAVGGRTKPFTRVLVLNRTNLTVLSELDIWSNDIAWLYPAFAVNARGHVAGTINLLGGTVHNSLISVIRDDYTPDIAANGWEGYTIWTGDDSLNSWGDYNGAMAHERYSNTWLGMGHSKSFGLANPVSFWVGRERDVLLPLTVTRSGNAASLGTVQTDFGGIVCGSQCSTNVLVGTVVTLSVSAPADVGFAGWSGGCTGTNACQLDMASSATVNAEFVMLPPLLVDGFE